MAGGCPPERCWETGSELVSPNRHWRTVMEHFAGIDVSLKQSSVCVVDDAGRFVRETKVASEPEALVRFFRGLGIGVTRIGLEAGPLSQWLHAGLVAAGFEVVLLETRHVKAALSAMVNKTDRKECARHRAVAAHGVVPPGACQVAQSPRGSCVARCTQAAADQAVGCGVQHPWHSTRVRAEHRQGEQGAVSGSGARVGSRTSDV